ncbi:Metacaspase-1B [Dissostichus eleginoides]|uniref:Metacaspase-1B n=1 Tax=Dissostichus eleginoides TaxID=100907 RepID=A0AAD9EV95_DISEL|nr:Metacaspase-1B [Dissostichus eleginoides]
MTDMEQTFIRSAITEVLPDLPEMTKDILEETLQSLGVETYEDFQFVNEADLLSALRPIQARKVLAAWKLRCQTPESSSSSVGGSPGPSASLMSYSPRSSSSTSSDSCKRPDIDWMDSFVIPWDKFPEELMQTLERGKRPSPQMRREMSKRLLQALTKFKVMRGELSGCSEDVKDMVLLLLSYFDEKEDTMFCYVEDTCLAGEVQMDQVQLTPTIVVCGK